MTSAPVGAQVFIDGQARGVAAPGRTFDVEAGRHSVRLVLGDVSLDRSVTVSSLRTNRFHWDVEAGTLSNTQ